MISDDPYQMGNFPGHTDSFTCLFFPARLLSFESLQLIPGSSCSSYPLHETFDVINHMIDDVLPAQDMQYVIKF